jgi:excisionase family DNA binding protein
MAVIERYLSPSEAARELGISSERVRQLVREGRLAAVRTPLGRLISPEALAALAEQRRRDRDPGGEAA